MANINIEIPANSYNQILQMFDLKHAGRTYLDSNNATIEKYTLEDWAKLVIIKYINNEYKNHRIQQNVAALKASAAKETNALGLVLENNIKPIGFIDTPIVLP